MPKRSNGCPGEAISSFVGEKDSYFAGGKLLKTCLTKSAFEILVPQNIFGSAHHELFISLLLLSIPKSLLDLLLLGERHLDVVFRWQNHVLLLSDEIEQV